MAYQNTKDLMDKYGINEEVIRDILEAFADEMEVAEPSAFNTIAATRSIAYEFMGAFDA